MNEEILRILIAEAAVAPSVHNVQPARWRIGDGSVTLLEDCRRRLPLADPSGNDAAMSLGAATEGLRIAASRRKLNVVITLVANAAVTSDFRPVANFRFEDGAATDPLAAFVERRQSWRGSFLEATEHDRGAARRLSADDATVVASPGEVDRTAAALDIASWHFMSKRPFRAEVLSWMRLSRRNPRWALDGLNADAMAMSGIEAWGAGTVLGPAFSTLNALGLAKTVVAETSKTRSSAGIVLFHRPAAEDPFECGRHFYRLWLRIEEAGFGAAVLAALADEPRTAAETSSRAHLPKGHRLVSAFRIGRRPAGATYARARLPLEELIVP